MSSTQAVKQKIFKYCAYRERCHKEVRDKLLQLGLRGMELEEMLAELIQKDFLNEERFARTYSRSKFRQNHWGRKKILMELKRRQISDYCIRMGMKEIVQEEYEDQLEQLAQRYMERQNGSAYVVRNKTARYLIGKGYEPDLVWMSLPKDGTQ